MIKGSPIVVTGLVLPAAWSEDGRVQSVTISAFDEAEYLVAPGPAAEALLDLLRREVEVTGRIGSQDSSSTIIEVESYVVKESSRDAGQD